MHKIDINDIQKYPENPRAGNVVDEIISPVSNILIDDEFNVLNGHIRLNVELDTNGTATVRVLGTNEQFRVRRDENGVIVRVDNTNDLDDSASLGM